MKTIFARTVRGCQIIFWMTAVGCTGLLGMTQDVVIIQNQDGNHSRRTGTIRQWLGNQIILATGSRERRIDSSTVLEVRTPWSAELLDARKLMAEKELANALGRYQQALAVEQRDWVRQLIIAEYIQALDASEAWSEAISQFVGLYRTDPQTRFFHLIPLHWSNQPQSAPGSSDVERWLAADEPILKLLGASWGLAEIDRPQAVRVLESLASSSDLRVAQLAITQLWRTELFSVQPADVGRWQRQLDHLLTDLRGGPLALIAEAQYRTGDIDRAQIAFMKIPILYPEKKSLSAFALFRCGLILAEQSSDVPATALTSNVYWTELLRDHPWSQYVRLVNDKF